MAGISLHLPIRHQPNAPLGYAGPESGLSWAQDRQELHARFKPVDLFTELLYGTLGLIILIGLTCVSLVLAGAGLFNRIDATESISALALGLPLTLIFCVLATQCLIHLVRRARYHNTFTTVHANRDELAIICPIEWAQPLHRFAAGDIRRIDVYTTGFDLSLSRIVYLRLWTGDDYRMTEIRFSTREPDLPERLDSALHDVLCLPRTGRRRIDKRPSAVAAG